MTPITIVERLVKGTALTAQEHDDNLNALKTASEELDYTVNNLPASGTNLSVGTITSSSVDVDSSTGTNATIPSSTVSFAGVMSAADKIKLDGIESGATADQLSSEVTVDTTSFVGNLSALDDTVQKALVTLDGLASTGGGTALTTSTDTTNFNSILSGADTDVQKALETLDNNAAPKASPIFTDNPLAPTAPAGTNTDQIATTAFVLANVGSGGGVSTSARNTVIAASASGSLTYSGTTVNIPSGNILSYSEGVDGTTGDLNSLETTTSIDLSLIANTKCFLYAKKGNIGIASTKNMLKGIDKNSADNWGVVSSGDPSFKTTATHSSYSSSTGIVSANSEVGGGYTAIQAFNKTVSSTLDWLSTTTTGWIQYAFSEERILRSYRIRSTSTLNRTAKDWTIQGSNDGISWTIFDTRTGFVPTLIDTFSPLYTITGDHAYKYIRMDITLNNGSPSYVGLDELELNTEYSGYFYNVESGVAVDNTDATVSIIKLGEVLADASGEAITDTLVVKRKTNDFVDVEVYGDISLINLPTVDTGFKGQLWNDSGTLKISLGA